MAVIPGTRLGVYQITAPLGEGGMGAGVARTRHDARARGGDQDPA